MNLWPTLLNPRATSPRNLFLYNIDRSRFIEAVRVGDWKLIKVSRGVGWGRAHPIFGTKKAIAFSTNAQSRFESVVLVLCSWDLRALTLTVSLYLCSSGSNARGKLRALEGCRVSSKSPSRVRDGDKGVAWRNGRELFLR